MTSKAQRLTVASHDDPSTFYEGGHYELNLSFEALRDREWQHSLEVLWEHESLYGPLMARYTPGARVPERIPVQVPPPTATLVQHGQMKVGDAIVGCDVQATRSLFECISVMVPIHMFAGLNAGGNLRHEHPELEEFDAVLYDIALRIYDAVPFKIAAIGYERECQLPLELRSDPQMRHAFLITGNFLAQDDVLASLEPDLTRYELVRSNLRWLAAVDLST